MRRTYETVGFVISAPRLDGVNATDVIDTTAHFDTDHLTPLAAELLRRCGICRTAEVSMAITPIDELARQLGTGPDDLRAAMHEIAAAGHGDANWSTLHVARWTPLDFDGRHPQRDMELAGTTAGR